MESDLPAPLNGTCDPEYPFFSKQSTILLGFVTTVIIAFGLTANALNFRIFTHKFMRVSLLNWYLAVLSLSDVVILITAFFFLSLPRMGEFFRDFRVVSFCNKMSLINYPVGLTAQTASVWLTILMSAHRFVGVCLPFKTGRICTRRNCRLALGGILLFAVLFNTTRFGEVTTVECYKTDINFTMVEARPTPMRSHETYTTIYVVWCYFLVMFFLPFLLLISLNSAVISAIRNTNRLHREAGAGVRRTSEGAEGASKKLEMSKETSTSIMLVGVVVVFLVCNTLAFVINILELIDSYSEEKRFVDSEAFPQIIDASNCLVLLNASINIFVYLSFSEKYRLLLKHYLTFSCFHSSEPLVDFSTL